MDLTRTLDNLRHWKGRRVLAAMSGGVDSAVTAALLHEAGAEVVGVHMRVWHYNGCDDEELNGKIATCCSPADANDARAVADRFGFPFYSIDFQADFRRAVIDPFIQEYLAGRTPNPCVHCNTQLKLGVLLGKAKSYGCEAVATGHYARVVPAETDGARVQLKRSADPVKDQTYYLFELRQAQLAHLVTPLGEMDKAETRAAARELGVEIAEKAESQDICFVEHGDYRRFLREEAGLDDEALAGAIVSTRGEVLGRHDGIQNYTVGQRRGLGVSANEPLYVVDLDPDSRTVIVGGADELLAEGLTAFRVNWVGVEPPAEPMPVLAQIRYRSRPVPATLRAINEAGTKIAVTFDEPQRAVTPGQVVVCYDAASGEDVLCGGWIER